MKTFIQIFKDCKTYCPYKNYSKEDMKEELLKEEMGKIGKTFTKAFKSKK